MVSVAHVGNGFGVGVWLQGGSATPSVTLENSFIAEADTAALAAETNSSTSELSVTIKGNSMNPGANNTETLYGIALFGGLTAAISDNLITGGPTAMWIESGSEGTISKNTIDGYNEDGAAIILKSDDMSVTGNTIEGNGEGVGIAVDSSVAPVTDNTIRFEDQGIDFVCIAGNNVHSNTIMGSNYGIIDVPASAVSANTYYSVGVSRQGGC
jgi:nitrous oxidase accessory protein NosD